ncbi:hypothetical protein FKV23_01975 [Lysobacter alkalisoli]|uniref:Uncharacterized protein n=2 Tax=Marilutibacter alkalisoli TaxID=2591633 RepID=A0A514BNV3_9GAMM|nr:hypothetical protein FKV23_01975 [Lysobacter alkalisoli]
MPAWAARDCEVALGHGWPPATENYGNAVESLLVDDDAPALMLTRLPARGTEDAVMLVPGAGGNWTLQYVTARKRVLNWTGSGAAMQRELQVEQTPKREMVEIPAGLAEHLVDAWRQTLAVAVPAGRDAPFSEDDTWLLVIDGQRVSGAVPGCGAAGFMAEQAELLIKAADTRESRLDKRWGKLERSLDRMAKARAADGGAPER